MRRRWLAIPLLVATALPLAAQERSGVVGAAALIGSALQTVSARPAIAPRPTLHLVAIGVEDYGIPVLQQSGASADAGRVAESLSELSRGFYTMDLHILAGAAATRRAVQATLDSVSARAEDGDFVVLYYRGLGGPRFLVLADTAAMPTAPAVPGSAPPPSFEARLLRSDALADWILSLRTRQLLLVLEAPEASSYFHALRERLAAPEGAQRATKDLVALATPGVPTALSFASGPSGVLTSAIIESLAEERDAGGLSLVSTLLPRVLYKLDAPIVVHEAGAELVLGADTRASAAGAALRNSGRWPACLRDCALLRLDREEGCCTVVGNSAALAASSKIFVNDRLARRDGPRFAVELPPAALRSELRIRVLNADYSRWETTQRLP